MRIVAIFTLLICLFQISCGDVSSTIELTADEQWICIDKKDSLLANLIINLNDELINKGHLTSLEDYQELVNSAKKGTIAIDIQKVISTTYPDLKSDFYYLTSYDALKCIVISNCLRNETSNISSVLCGEPLNSEFKTEYQLTSEVNPKEQRIAILYASWYYLNKN